MADPKVRYAVVTGANKGIGFEICRQLASKGIKVVLTARDEKRGHEAEEALKSSAVSDNVTFHQLDVADPASISSLAGFVKTQFGRLDILVNNAGISGAIWNSEALKNSGIFYGVEWAKINWTEILTETCELAEECIRTNYYGAKRMVEAFIPLLQLSDSPRIVNVSSKAGKLEHIQNEWAKRFLSEIELLTEEKVDAVLSEFMKDFREGSLESKGWPPSLSAYHVSKAAMNSYTRLLAKKYPSFIVNCICPGFVKTDINSNSGSLTVEEGAEGPVKLALLPNGGPSGLFFDRTQVSPF